jgi:signal transduction histidine kinase
MQIIEMNPAAEKIIRLRRIEIQAKNLKEIWSELYKMVAESPDTLHGELTVERVESLMYLDMSVVNLLDSRQKLAGKLVVMRDVSELKSAHRKLEALYDEEHKLRGSLEEEIKKRSQYSRAIVHELRTPLTSIIACSDLLEEEVKDEIQLKLVQNIRRSTLNLEQRVSEMFELARGELGMIKINPVPLDMNLLIQEIIAEMNPLTLKDVLLRSEVPEIIVPVMGDRSRLRQVLINLVGNSIKFTSQGEIVVKAKYFDADFLQVQVADTGCGMKKEHLENLFDPYHRQPAEGGRNSGLGIGLALSKIIIELHRGRIWAESTPGKGTTISFTVPFDSQMSISGQGTDHETLSGGVPNPSIKGPKTE